VESVTYDPEEQLFILDVFAEMLSKPTRDGGRKRAAGTKIPLTEDPDHEDAMYRHLGRYERGEWVDEDSGAHPLVHVAWRALALAYQQRRETL
jgi:hypothetical protein